MTQHVVLSAGRFDTATAAGPGVDRALRDLAETLPAGWGLTEMTRSAAGWYVVAGAHCDLHGSWECADTMSALAETLVVALQKLRQRILVEQRRLS